MTSESKDEKVTVGDLPAYLTDEILHALRHYAACIARMPGETEPLYQCGSGTFVRYREHFGILTAAHVIRAIENLAQWHLIFPGSGQGHIVVDRNTVEYLCSDKAQVEQDGPDIGFVRLSSHSVGQIASLFSFVNLENHESRLNAEDIPIDHGVWVEMGYPEELGNRSRDVDQRISTTQVYCLASVGTVDRITHRDGFDYYDSIVEYTESNSLPTSFKGISGAGLWQVRLSKRKNRYEIRDRFLSGVVYYENASDGTVTDIRSHGRESIYEYVIPRLILK